MFRIREAVQLLMRAACRGNYECVDSLIHAGAYVNIADNEGLTPLYEVCKSNQNNRLKIVKLLLAAGANVNLVTGQGKSIMKTYQTMWMPQREEMINVLTLLYSAGEDINEVPEDIRDEVLPETEICLMNICREAIRKYMLHIRVSNLFVRVHKLGLPTLLQSFLLHNMSLDDDDDDDDSDLHQETPCTSDKESQEAPCSSDDIHQEAPCSSDNIHQEALCSSDEIHQETPCSSDNIHQEASCSSEDIHQGTPCSSEDIQQEALCGSDEISTEAPCSSEDIHHGTSLMEDMSQITSLCKYCKRFVDIHTVNVNFHNAARFGHCNCVKILLREGADVNYKQYIDRYGKITALLAAAQNGHDSCARILIEAGADVNCYLNQDKLDFLWYVILSGGKSPGHAAFVELLIQAGVGVNNEVLGTAVYLHKGVDKCLEVFVREGADVNSKEGAEALNKACRNGYDKCLDVLLKAGANINGDNGCRALEYAAEWGHHKCVNLLINAGADVRNCNGTIPLMKASEFGHDKCVKALLNAGVNVNMENEDGQMALGVAARGSDPFWYDGNERVEECVNAFITAGADVNTRDKYGFTALLYAAENGFDTCVKRMLQAGADVNVRDANGNTALQVMFIQRRWVIFPQCIRALLAAGIYLNQVNNEGDSAVMMWMSERLEELKSFITETGDDPQRRHRELEVVTLLFAAGENIEAAPEEVRNKVNPPTQMGLSHLCSDIIRKHLLDLDEHENLFVRVPRLNLSEHLQNYLLSNMEKDNEENRN